MTDAERRRKVDGPGNRQRTLLAAVLRERPGRETGGEEESGELSGVEGTARKGNETESGRGEEGEQSGFHGWKRVDAMKTRQPWKSYTPGPNG